MLLGVAGLVLQSAEGYYRHNKPADAPYSPAGKSEVMVEGENATDSPGNFSTAEELVGGPARHARRFFSRRCHVQDAESSEDIVRRGDAARSGDSAKRVFAVAPRAGPGTRRSIAQLRAASRGQPPSFIIGVSAHSPGAAVVAARIISNASAVNRNISRWLEIEQRACGDNWDAAAARLRECGSRMRSRASERCDFCLCLRHGMNCNGDNSRPERLRLPCSRKPAAS